MSDLAVGGLPQPREAARGRAGKSRALFRSAIVPGAEHLGDVGRIALMDRRRKAANDRPANDNERRFDRRGARPVSLEERLLAELSYGYAT
jgi:hypothetical protein